MSTINYFLFYCLLLYLSPHTLNILCGWQLIGSHDPLCGVDWREVERLLLFLFCHPRYHRLDEQSFIAHLCIWGECVLFGNEYLDTC